MNRRTLMRTLGLASLLCASALLSTGTASAAPKPDVTAPLAVGETLRYAKDLRITFLAVTKDCRCPINATCISAGDAEILIRVKAGTALPRNYKIHTDRKPSYQVIPVRYPEPRIGIPKSYTLRIDELTPLPFAGKKTRQSDYRLKLGITVAQ